MVFGVISDFPSFWQRLCAIWADFWRMCNAYYIGLVVIIYGTEQPRTTKFTYIIIDFITCLIL